MPRKRGANWDGTGHYEPMSKRFAARFTEANFEILEDYAYKHNVSLNQALNDLVAGAGDSPAPSKLV